MELTRRTLIGASAGVAALAGCLGGGEGDGDETTAATETTEETGSENGTDEMAAEGDDGSDGDATVQVRAHDEHGDVLVGPDGMSLYNFDQDARGTGESACYDGCAENWPPLTVDGEPTAGEDVIADLSTFEREDGSTQVAAAGWPLYYFAADEEPGDANGQGANDVWWLLRPDGSLVKPDDGDESGGGGSDDDGSDDGSDGGYGGYGGD
ncbi:hypothetical protein G9464_12525 [Halostella sp. JP-L12]|uniref:COG4315 family predicted lipoprotein n=1 Tax=Halostella TaxID=1843185 RepID=UPI000EF82BE4|nr:MULTISPECIES: hypothetical protein [Halostella]NHN48412.1 hypothetical protein [Halostella sp. JP-L12]